MATYLSLGRSSLSILIAGILASTVAAQGFGAADEGGGRRVGRAFRGRSQESGSRTVALIGVIQATVEPSTWDDVGGEGSIEIVEPWGLAVVSQTRSVHDRIEALLRTVRSVRAQQDGTPTTDAQSASAEEVGAGQSVKQIEKALGSTTTLSLSDAPLEQAIEHIKQQHGIQFTLDRRSLEDIGLTPGAPVNIEVSGISLRSALNLLLDELGLTYVIANEVLMITTPESADSRLVTRVYPVRDLLAE